MSLREIPARAVPRGRGQGRREERPGSSRKSQESAWFDHSPSVQPVHELGFNIQLCPTPAATAPSRAVQVWGCLSTHGVPTVSPQVTGHSSTGVGLGTASVPITCPEPRLLQPAHPSRDTNALSFSPATAAETESVFRAESCCSLCRRAPKAPGSSRSPAQVSASSICCPAGTVEGAGALLQNFRGCEMR